MVPLQPEVYDPSLNAFFHRDHVPTDLLLQAMCAHQAALSMALATRSSFRLLCKEARQHAGAFLGPKSLRIRIT